VTEKDKSERRATAAQQEKREMAGARIGPRGGGMKRRQKTKAEKIERRNEL
jgi:hypothetical protein